MKRSQFVCVAGMLGSLLGCSGRYEVGKLPNGASGIGGDDAAGGAFTNVPVFVGYGGSSPTVAGGGNEGPSAGGGGAVAGGMVPTAGSSSAAGPSSYCGSALPASHDVPFATPDLVWQRIQRFLLDRGDGPPPDLPPVTTRAWAAEQAMATLDSLTDDPAMPTPYLAAPGLVRFINGWLPGAQEPAKWASLLGSSSTLHDLLTTALGQPRGAGVLTDGGVLALPNLVYRGAYIARNVVCLTVPTPPRGIPPLPSGVTGATRRAQFAMHTSSPACAACHARIDPFGIALEHFDQVGQYTDLDNGFPIDSSSSAALPQSGIISFADANDLGAQLADSCEVAQCLTQRLLADAEISAALPVPGSTDPATVAEIAFASSQSKHNLRGLIWYLVQSDTFLRAP